MLEVYRADTRSPDTIKGEKCFKAWQPLEYEEAKRVLKKFCGADIDLGLKSKAAEGLINRLKTPKLKFDKQLKRNLPTGDFYPLNKNDLSRLIKSQKTRESFWISTDEKEDCGGQANGYIYKMRFDSSSLSLPGLNSFAAKIGLSKTEKTSSWVRLLMDPSLKIIAVHISGGAGAEISFLTRIPLKYIVEVRPLSGYTMPSSFGSPNAEGWYAMSQHAASSHPGMGQTRPQIPSRKGRPPIPPRNRRPKKF
ncbi:MAG: hypothetical protein KZQ90_15205 [Candidatus Thiodiazotropha sp. (ex Codakia rugifera)]|nr:hypothetical protein [Candidatus Thiodiazotropha sp. (ex Codakia rugifera)]